MKTKLRITIFAIGLICFLFAGINLTAQINWEKYEGNPMITGTAWFDEAARPVVIYEDDIFKMWFSSNSRIGYAESTDGFNWMPNSNPVMQDASPGAWDEGKYPGSVLRVNDTLKMWYSGSSDNFSFEISIGYAWSLDNVVWNILPNPVLEKDVPGTWDETGVFQPVVYYDGTTYHMWYGGFEGTSWWDPMMEGYATSTNGINWTKHPDNPVLALGEAGSFYEFWAIGTSILYYNDAYHMWFAGWDGTSTSPFKYWRIGYATSPDGLVWTVHNNDQPVVDVGELGTWDDIWARYCSVIIHNDSLKMWYDGRGNVTSIGFALGDPIEVGIREKYAKNPVTISPNPINSNTVISLELTDKTKVKLEIYNHQGQKVSTVLNKNLQSGEQSVIFDGSLLSPGIYFCILKTNQGTQTKKIIKL